MFGLSLFPRCESGGRRKGVSGLWDLVMVVVMMLGVRLINVAASGRNVMSSSAVADVESCPRRCCVMKDTS